MSYFEDFVEDGAACMDCGEILDDQPAGYIRRCTECRKLAQKKLKAQENAKSRKAS